jgi:cytochrome P450
MIASAPPSPRANPLFGSALDLRRNRIQTYERVMREHGDVVRLVVGPPGARFDLYCVFHPDDVKAVLAGHETTSTALTFTLHLLGRHPGEQQLVHDEIDAVLDGRLPTVDDMPALERTARAIKEALRLYPPAYAVGRRAESDQQIGGYPIPAGSFVVVSQFATHRHPRFWDNPEMFDPSRFTAERETARHRYAYFPFGAGPRSCIGSHFAILEATIAVAVLLQRFRIESELEDVPVDSDGITLRPGGAVPVRPAAR